MNAISAITSLFGMIMSLFGMGTATYSQVNSTRAMMAAQQQAQVQTYRCPPSSQGQLRPMPDGSYQFVCVQQGAQP